MARSFTLALLIIFFFCKGYSQVTYPIDDYDGQVVTTCSGFFADSGTDTLTSYGSEEDYTITFASSDEERPYISIEFLFFDLGAGDYMSVYDGENDNGTLLYNATGDELAGKVLWASTDSLHFHFTSSPSDHGNGWLAKISCYSLNELFTAEVTTDLETMRLCPDPEPGWVTVMAEAFYKSEHIDFDPDQIEYTWRYNGQTETGPSISYEFYDPGAYPFHINIDDLDREDVEIDIYETVQVGTVPSFTGTHPSIDTTCAEDEFTLLGVTSMNTWTGFPTSVEETVPVDVTPQPYVSSLTFDVFEDDQIVESDKDFGHICVVADHIDYRQLRFELECPDGSDVLFKDYAGEEYPGANLGKPIAADHIDDYGEGYEYCFTLSEFAEYGLMRETTPQNHMYTDRFGNYYASAYYLPEGTYTSYESLENLTGCPLNGEWTLTVTDTTAGEKGYIHEWSLFFSDDFYPDSLIFTPEIVSETWYDKETETELEDNPALSNKDEEGEYEFIFEVIDNFNCTYDTTVTVTVLPLPEAEIISELELPFCEGDSTLLTINPIYNDYQHWVYQWYIDNIELPERTYDTIMAKELGTYSVSITDTITGCITFLDKDVNEENCDLEIPNVFTPNFDGINDEFEIINLDKYERAHIVIYNRWGKIMFEHPDYNDNWWDGDGAPDGVYYYVLSYERLGVTKRKHGVVHIVR